MINSKIIKKFQQKLDSASSILILLPPKPDSDMLVATLSLYSSLKETKNIQLGCSSSVDSQLPYADQIKTNIGNKNLIISFPYQQQSVDHVSYDIDEQKQTFNLRVKPSSQGQPLDPDQVSYSFTGAQADLAIVLGIKSLPELGNLYSDEKEFLDQVEIVNIHSFPQKTTFPAIDISTSSAGLSQITASLIKKTKLPLQKTFANHLYQQIQKNTNNFQSKVTPQTFRLAAYLLENSSSRPSSSQPPFFPSSSGHQSSTSSPSSTVPTDWKQPKIYQGSSRK